MAAFIETQQALADMSANTLYGQGGHVHAQVRAGTNGIYLGDQQFDAARHSVLDINPLSQMAMATGDQYVSQILPGKPLSLNVVMDFLNRDEHPAITTAKQSIASQIEAAITDALPSVTDRLQAFSLGKPKLQLTTDTEQLVGPEATQSKIKDAIADLACQGLTMVISDFRCLPLDYQQADSLIAVKVNFPTERAIPASVGFISIGGWGEVNTNDSRQVDYVNERLEAEHLRITGALERSGAKVASVVLKPSAAIGYDVVKADRAIATATRMLKA